MTKILVIDDKKDNLVAVKAILKNIEPDYEVLTAENGIEGIELAKSKQPDTILLDVHMPRIDGYEVCRRLRADRKTNRIPIIFLTAVKTSSKDRIRGLELGGDAYLTKPIDEGELLATLHAMLRIKKAEDERLHQYKNIVSSSTDMLALIDKEFTYRAVNQAYADAFEKTPDDLVGYTVSEIIGKEFFETVIKPNAERCLAGETVNFQDWFDFPAYEKRYMDITYSPYITEKKEIEGFVVNARNITKLKQTEEEKEQSQSLLNAALESTADGILVVDREKSWSSFNQKFIDIWGFPSSIRDSHDDKAALEYVYDLLEDPDEFMAKIREMYDNPEKNSFDSFKIKDGRIFERYSYPQRLGGEVVGRVWSFRDITERKRAEDALKQKMEQLDRANKLMVGRELKMIELKTEVNEQLEKSGLPKKYKTPDEVKKTY